MKVYISMSSTDLNLARSRMTAIRAMGHELAIDWTASFNMPRSSWPLQILRDVDGVTDSDVMVLFGNPTNGCFVELGAAIAARKPVVWVVEDESKALECNYFFLDYHGAWIVSEDNLERFLAFVNLCQRRE